MSQGASRDYFSAIILVVFQVTGLKREYITIRVLEREGEVKSIKRENKNYLFKLKLNFSHLVLVIIKGFPNYY